MKVDWTERLLALGEWLMARFQEPSTWRGITWMITAGSWAALDNTSKGELIAQGGMFLVGAIQAFVPQRVLYKTKDE